MNVLENMKEILEDELKKIAKKGDINPTELEATYKVVDIIKDIETIEAMREYGEDENEVTSKYSRRNYSNRMMSYDRPAMSYAYNNAPMHTAQPANVSHVMPYSYDGRTGRDADNDGRYSEDGASYRRGRDPQTGRYVSRDDRSYDNYSRHTEKEKRMVAKLENMLNETKDETKRMAIMQCIDKLED